MRSVIIFDADNTIWDTDAVFRSAQLALLQTLASDGLLDNPASHLTLLRAIDCHLMALHGKAEYGFDALALALIIAFTRHCSAEEAASEAFTEAQTQDFERYRPLIHMAHNTFADALHQPPPLFADALAILLSLRAASISASSIATILMTEGDTTRIERAFSAHRFRERTLFDEILILEKNADTMAYARSVGYRILCVSEETTPILTVFVGDSLKRDIQPANRAGFVTVYKPAAFKGFEIPQADDETPTHVIHSLAELPHLLARLGAEIQTVASQG